jgi:GT2 family glycosyltransferase
MTKPLVSIVILNWNGKEHLAGCLDSVVQTTYTPLEIILVDNGSTDGSVEFVRLQYPSAHIVENGRNLGYAEGNNKGIEQARGKYIVTLNNDIVVEPTWLDKPIQYLESDRRLGIVSCRQMNYYNHFLIDCLFHYPAPDLSFARVGHGETFDSASWHNNPGYVIAPNGGSAIYRKEMFDQLGGFDISFFAYHDETDLGMRAFLNGWKCLYVPDAIVFHKDAASFKKTGGKGHYFYARNKLWFMFKYFPYSVIIRHFKGIILEELRMFKRLVFKEKEPVLYFKARLDGIIGAFKFSIIRKKYINIFFQHSNDFFKLEKEKIIPL